MEKLIKKDREESYKEIAVKIRKNILQMHFKGKASHIASSLSCVDILVALYYNILKVDPKNPCSNDRDIFILSKGHACSALYAVLVKRGFAKEDLLDKYCVNSGTLLGHSTRGCMPGIEVSTGSLGHGLSMGAGMALARRQDKNRSKVFVLMSDGECNEGSVWEAAMFAGHHGLDNLIAIVDYNKIQAFGRIKEVMDLEPFSEKWKAFRWDVREVDGHDYNEIISNLKEIPFTKEHPSILIAHTIKGKGISFMEDKIEWHFKNPSETDLEMAMRELDAI